MKLEIPQILESAFIAMLIIALLFNAIDYAILFLVWSVWWKLERQEVKK